MYDDIAEIYEQIFPLNSAFLDFLKPELSSSSRILDLACGTGNLVNTLAQDGHIVTGIDFSQSMITYAKKHYQGIFRQMSFLQIDQLEGMFDVIYCIGNSFSYLEKKHRAVFFGILNKLIKPQGILIIQLVNWDRYLSSGVQQFKPARLLDGRIFTRKYEPGKHGAVIFKTALQFEGKVEKFWKDTLYPIKKNDLEGLIHQAGFSRHSVYGNYQKAGFELDKSPALIIKAVK